MNPTGCSTKAQNDGELTREPLAVGSSCKDYFVADVGHVRRRDSVVGSRSRVSGSEKGGEGRGRLSAMRRGSGRRDGCRTGLNE